MAGRLLDTDLDLSMLNLNNAWALTDGLMRQISLINVGRQILIIAKKKGKKMGHITSK